MPAVKLWGVRLYGASGFPVSLGRTKKYEASPKLNVSVEMNNQTIVIYIGVMMIWAWRVRGAADDQWEVIGCFQDMNSNYTTLILILRTAEKRARRFENRQTCLFS